MSEFTLGGRVQQDDTASGSKGPSKSISNKEVVPEMSPVSAQKPRPVTKYDKWQATLSNYLTAVSSMNLSLAEEDNKVQLSILEVQQEIAKENNQTLVQLERMKQEFETNRREEDRKHHMEELERKMAFLEQQNRRKREHKVEQDQKKMVGKAGNTED